MGIAVEITRKVGIAIKITRKLSGISSKNNTLIKWE